MAKLNHIRSYIFLKMPDFWNSSWVMWVGPYYFLVIYCLFSLSLYSHKNWQNISNFILTILHSASLRPLDRSSRSLYKCTWYVYTVSGDTSIAMLYEDWKHTRNTKAVAQQNQTQKCCKIIHSDGEQLCQWKFFNILMCH